MVAVRAVVLGNDVLQGVDVFEYGYCAFGAKEPDQFVAPGALLRCNPNEGHAGGFGSTGIVDGVADVPAAAMAERCTDFVEPLGIGLRMSDVVGTDHRMEAVGQK